MSLERVPSKRIARSAAMPPAKENIEKLEKMVTQGNYYGAQQMYKSFSARYAAAERYNEALDVLQSGACLQLGNQQVTCGAELAMLFVEILVKGKYPYDDDTLARVRKIYKKFPRISVPQHLDMTDDDDIQKLSEALGAAKIRVESCSSFLRAAIKWSVEFGAGRNGSPELHDMLADYIYSESPEADMAKVSFHFVRGKNPKKFASTLLNFMGKFLEINISNGAMYFGLQRKQFLYIITKCYPGEDDLAIAQAVLMYLSLGNLRDANNLMDELRKQVHSNEIEFPESELIQFITYLLLTLQRDALPLFNMLKQNYRSSLEREAIFSELLDEIAGKFYRVQRRNPLQGIFGDLFKMMGNE